MEASVDVIVLVDMDCVKVLRMEESLDVILVMFKV